MVELERITALNGQGPAAGGGYVLYWMQASQRAMDNPALAHAAALADGLKLPLAVAFVRTVVGRASSAHYGWMLAGLAETAASLKRAGIGFLYRETSCVQEALEALRKLAAEAAVLVSDANPAPWARSMRDRLASTLSIPMYDVDGDSVVPLRHASPKREWSARTLRVKLAGAIDHYLDTPALGLPCPKKAWKGEASSVPANLLPGSASLSAVKGAWPALYPRPGSEAAGERMQAFVNGALSGYDQARNDPNANGCSGLSAYLHFGQLSPVALARAARDSDAPPADRAAFLEQLVVRRELCRNYAWHAGPLAERWEGLPDWSRATLTEHASDARPYRYGLSDFRAARTHDPYWNAAQRQLEHSGGIHNYMRMYWGKMILAWSPDPRAAFDAAIALNDGLALDGRDPNGWAGVAWCFGLHDRPWPSRSVFGSVRAMAASGLKRKFDADAYARAWSG